MRPYPDRSRGEAGIPGAVAAVADTLKAMGIKQQVTDVATTA